MDESKEDWAIQKGFDSRVVLPFTWQMVEEARNRQDYFTRAQVHDVILRCWNTLKTRLKDEGASVVCVDITHSRPWQKVIAAASDKIRSKLVGPGICSCHLEMDAKRINPHNNLPHPNFVLTHGNGVEDVEVLSAVSSWEAEGFLNGSSLQDWRRRAVWSGGAKQGWHKPRFSTCHEREGY